MERIRGINKAKSQQVLPFMKARKGNKSQTPLVDVEVNQKPGSKPGQLKLFETEPKNKYKYPLFELERPKGPRVLERLSSLPANEVKTERENAVFVTYQYDFFRAPGFKEKFAEKRSQTRGEYDGNVHSFELWQEKSKIATAELWTLKEAAGLLQIPLERLQKLSNGKKCLFLNCTADKIFLNSRKLQSANILETLANDLQALAKSEKTERLVSVTFPGHQNKFLKELNRMREKALRKLEFKPTRFPDNPNVHWAKDI
ncbi:MAG: hypothetical protein V1847_03090 [Candidatus Diapherotrites archaeon]